MKAFRPGAAIRRLALVLLAACVLGASLSHSAEKEPFTPRDVARLRAVLSAEISPDGKHIAYVLAVPRDLKKEKDGTSWSELHVLDEAGKSHPYVTGQVSVGDVRWTPDGKGISFLTKRDKDEHRALYVISLAGGEARKVLEHKSDISSYSWAADGKQVAFLATKPKSKEEKEREDKGFNQEIYEEDVPFTRVWIGSIEDDADEPRMLALEGNASDLVWSPEGSLLAVALTEKPLIDDYLMFRKVHTVDPREGKVVASLDNPGKIGPLAWSPDGKYLALVSGEDKHDPAEGQLWVIEARGGEWKNLLPDYEAHVLSMAWRDNNTLVYVAAEGVWTVVGEVQRDGTGSQKLVPRGGPILHSIGLSDDGKAGVLVGESPTFPPEVFRFDPATKEPKRLTTSNPWLEEKALAKQEVITWKARDGLELQGILVRPLEEETGKRYPLVLTVHGGPEAHEPNGWMTSYHRLGQVGAANGFMVFYPNYRGSTGRGVPFSKMGQEDAAGKEFDDLVDAVDHLIKLGLVDRDRVGITGGSYGGYATAWASTYYSDRFAAGVMFVGISDVLSKTGTTDIPYEMYLVHHRKWLWQDWDYFLKRSPIYHIEKAHTPLLILHGKNDPRVHPSQSLELYRHLKVRDKAPVRLVLYPGEGHGNRRAASRLDYNLRLLRWMKHFLQEGDKKAPPYQLDYGLKEKDDKKKDDKKKDKKEE